MKPVKFKVSGQITQYRGKNYLLLRSVTIVRDMHGGIGGCVTAARFGAAHQGFGFAGSGASTGPPAFFQAPKPPRI